MSLNLGNVGGLLGAVVGFVVLAEGIRLIRSSQKGLYQKNGYKIHPMKDLHKYKKSYSHIYAGALDKPLKIKMPRI